MRTITIGLLRETKDPPDKRVPLTPLQCRQLLEQYPQLKIQVQSSGYRCYADDEYRAQHIPLAEDLSSCDMLMGVKEVKEETLVPDKTYLFFSHTAKKQDYNRSLLQALVGKGIRMIDYEYLTGEDGVRVVAFGRWAGVVGAYNGLRAFGLKQAAHGFELKAAHECFNLEELKEELQKVSLAQTRILLTGGGRVAGGALEILDEIGIRKVSPGAFLQKEMDHPVYTRLDPWHYTRRRDEEDFSFGHFVNHPESYENAIQPYLRKAHIFMACHFWDPRSPVMLTREDLASGDLPLSVIADISCDINGPIASTIRASTIADPFYGYDASTGNEAGAFEKDALTVMAVDNLPGELPRDASADFGKALMEHVIPELIGKTESSMLERATISRNGQLGPEYSYLSDFLKGLE